jgi:hypothetical protein
MPIDDAIADLTGTVEEPIDLSNLPKLANAETIKKLSSMYSDFRNIHIIPYIDESNDYLDYTIDATKKFLQNEEQYKDLFKNLNNLDASLLQYNISLQEISDFNEVIKITIPQSVKNSTLQDVAGYVNNINNIDSVDYDKQNDVIDNLINRINKNIYALSSEENILESVIIAKHTSLAVRNIMTMIFPSLTHDADKRFLDGLKKIVDLCEPYKIKFENGEYKIKFETENGW